MNKKLRGKKTFFAKRRIIITAIMLFVTTLIPSVAVFATDYSASITTSGDVELVSPSGQIVIDHSDVGIITNCKAGYNLTLGTSVNDNNLYLDGDSSNNSANTYVSPANGTSALKDSTNTWGYFASFDTTPVTPTENSIFSPVPTLANDPAILRTPTETASATDINDSFSIYYGANIGSGMRAGTYTMIPEDSAASTPQPGRLAYYLTMDMSCLSDLAITFNKNIDGEGGEEDPGATISNFPTSSDNTIDLINKTVTLSNKRPARTGYQFKEWNTEMDGTGNYYYPSDIISIGESSETGSHGTPLQGFVTLYAIWVEDCANATVCYDGNHQDAGAMNTQSINAGATANLIASNFSRPGYGFTGWNTEADGTGTQYGPNQNLTMPSTGGVNLYAQWLAPSGTFQTWSATGHANNMNVGDVIALKDERDNEVYMVAKLADGNIWTTENLRLLPNTATINNRNTNHPTTGFVNAAPSSSSTTSQCSTDNATCDNQIYFNAHNLDRTLTPAYNGATNSTYWYSYGVMYNWYTATAGNGTYELVNSNAAGDLCPAGWHMPTGGSSGEWGVLANNMTGGNGTAKSATLRSYPNNFLYSGDYNPSKNIPDGVGRQGRLWSTTPVSSNIKNAYRMGYNASEITAATSNSWNKWDNFAIRCIYQGGNAIFVDATVTFPDDTVTSIDFYNADYGTVTATPQSPIVSLAENTEYTITATLAPGYELSSWTAGEGAAISDTTENPTTLTITGATTLSLTSEAQTLTCTKQYRLQNADGTYPNTYTEDGSETKSYGETCSYSKSETNYETTSSTVEVLENTTISLDLPRTTYTLTINKNNTHIASTTTTAARRWGEVVNITATPVAGSRFTSWTQTAGDTGTFADSTSASTTFTMPLSDATIYADGESIPTHDLNLTLDQGVSSISFMHADYPTITITNENAGTSGKTTTASLREGVPYIITATTSTGYEFSSWTAGTNATIESTTENPTTITLTNDSSLSATTTDNRILINYNGNGLYYNDDTTDTNNQVYYTRTNGLVRVSGSYLVPSSSRTHTFLGWSENQNAATATYTDEAAVIANSGYTHSDSPVTLYAIYQSASEVTVNFDEHVTSITFTAEGKDPQTVTTSGSTVEMWKDTPYAVTATFETDYVINAWTTTSDGTISNPNSSTTTYTVTGDATLSLTSKQLTPMQSFSISQCNAMNNGDTAALYDTRDNTVYNIGKLADGNCWLLDNLRLDLTDSSVVNGLSPQNTNADSASLTSLRNSNRLNGDQYATQGLSQTSEDWTTSNGFFSVPMVNTTYKDMTATTFGSGLDKIGVYYNYCAASAGSYCWGMGQSSNGSNYESPSTDPNPSSLYDIDGDICPSGWRMPTGGATGEYGVLYSSYNNTVSDVFNAFSAIHSGTVSSSQSNTGYFWSSTWDGNPTVTILINGADTYYGFAPFGRVDGLPVRCLLDKSHPTTVNFSGTGISSVTFTDSLDNTQTANDGDTIKLKDGETYTVTANTLLGYELDSWSATGGTLGSTTANPTTYTATSSSIITVTAKNMPLNTVTVRYDENVSSISFYNAELGTQTITIDDNFSSTVSLLRGVQYIVTPSFTRDDITYSWSSTEQGNIESYVGEDAIIYTITDDSTITLSTITKNGSSYLDKGKIISLKITNLAGGSSGSIKSIKTLKSLPSNFTPSTANTISLDHSEKPAYAIFDNTNNEGIIYVYSDASDVYMNEDSSYMLSGYNSLTDISALSDWNSSGTTDMSGLFEYSSSLNDLNPLRNWDTRNVTNMDSLFRGSSLTSLEALSDWNTNKVTNMNFMFYGNSSLESLHGLETWDTGNVTAMLEVFRELTSLTDISALSNWNTSNVKKINYMFYGDTSLTSLRGLENWNTSSIQLMAQVFYQDSALTDISALSNWDTSNVTDMTGLFYGNTSLNDIGALSNWDTGCVLDMRSMFNQTSSLKDATPINDWDIRAVIAESGSSNYDTNNFTYMFAGSGGNYPNIVHPTFSKRSGTWDSNGTFIPGDTVQGDTTITINFDNHIRRIIIEIPVSPGEKPIGPFIIDTSGSSVNLKKEHHIPYVITAELETGYELSEFASNDQVSLSSIINNSATFFPTNEATITAVSREVPTYNTTVIMDEDSVSGVTFSNSQYGSLEVTKNEETIALKQGVTYDVMATVKPTSSFISWSSTIDNAIDNEYANPAKFTPTTNSTLTVSSEISSAFPVHVELDDGISSLSFFNASYGVQSIVNNGNSSTNTIMLKPGIVYVLSPSLRNGYMVNQWSTTGEGAFKISSNVATYSITGSSSIRLTSKQKAGSATLVTGKELNSKMKTLAIGNSTNYNTYTEVIESIQRADYLPEGFNASDNNIISSPESEHAVYIFFDNSQNHHTIYYYSEAEDIYMNPDSSYAFYGLRSLADISGLANLKTGSITDMSYMFYSDRSITNIDALSNWDTSKVIDMNNSMAFLSLTNLNSLANWDVSNVVNMDGMFYYDDKVENLEALANWDVSNVSNLHHTFSEMNMISDLSPLAEWNTSKVIDMSGLFASNNRTSRIDSLEGLENWNTSSVINMDSMFFGIDLITDLNSISSWDVSSVTSMKRMFTYCFSLTDAYGINNWDIGSVTATAGSSSSSNNSFYHMFYYAGNSPISAYHPEFTKRQGTWDTEGTFIPGDTTIPENNAVTITIDFGEHVRSIGFYNSSYGTSQVTPASPVIKIAKNTQYTISSSYDAGYNISTWSTTEAGTLGSINSRATTYTVTGDATLSITATTNSKLYMQDFTNEDCNGLNIGETLTLYDRRDETTYTTTRTGDGLCWMTSDLHLGSTSSSMTLRNTDTDIAASTFTLPKVETSSNKTQWGTNNSTTGLNTAHAYRYNETKHLYNYYAATAGTSYSTITPTTSICPKGWKLPTQAQANTYLRVLGESNGSTNTEVITGPPLNLTSGLYDTNKTAYTNKAYWVAGGWYNKYYYGYYFGIRTSSNVNYVQTSYGYQKMVGLGIRCVHASDKQSNFTISLDATGGTVNPRTLTGTTTQIMSNLPTPTREGSSFDGWYTQIEGGETISATNIRTGTSTYYAHWSASVPVNFDNGISSITISDGTNTQTISNSGDTVTLNPSIEYTITATSASGFQFSSWSVTGATLGDINSSTTTFMVTGVATLSAISVVNQVDINYDGNGLYFNNDPENSTNQVSYLRAEGTKSVTRYSHTANINDEGVANGTYANNLSTTDTVTIPGATSMNVTVYYDTESASYDWVSVYQDPFTISNNNDASVSATTGNLSGKLAGQKSGRTTSYSTWYSQTYTITGDTVKFHFRSDGSGAYYGYYAIITANATTETLNPISGTYATPSSSTPHTFLGWSEDRNATIPTYTSEQDIIDNATYTVSDSPVTLYAIYQSAKTVTVNLDSNVASVSFMNDIYPARTITESGEVELYSNSPYIITASFADGYTLDSWTTSTGGTIESPISLATTYTITAPTTLSVTSKAPGSISSFTPSACASLSIGDVVELTDSRDGSTYKVSKLADNNCWMLDNLRLDLTDSTVQSNLTSSTTNATNDTLSYLKGAKTGTTSDKYPTTAATISSARSYSAPNINTTYKDSDASVTYGNGSGKIGVYYNYCAASAGSYCYGNGTSTTGTPSSDPNTNTLIDVTEDICPAGWRMPTSGTNGEYQALYNAYSTASEGQVLGFKNALSTPLSGYFDNNSISSQGTYGDFWSSTYYYSSYMYRLYETTTAVTPSSYGYRYDGYPVRCILGAPSFSNVTVNLDANTDIITFTNPTYGTITVTPDNNTVELRQGVEYTITANIPSVAYDFASWSTSGDVTISSTTTNPTAFTINGDSTLSVSTTEKPSYEVTVNIDEHVRSVAFYQDTLGVQQVTTSGNTVSLRRGVEYIMTATFEEDYATGTWTTTENGTIGSTILPATTYTVTGPATLSLTSKSKTGSTTLLPGQQLNVKMKTLAEGRTTTCDTASSKIKSLQMASALPADFIPSTSNTVSTADSEQPIYIFFNNEDNAGIMYFYTDARDIYMNADSGSAFRRNLALHDISAVSSWNTSYVTNMNYMFYNVYALLNISVLANWNTSNVTSMSNMFGEAFALTNIDALANWDTSNVTNMSNMFYRAYALTNIDGARNWNTSNVTNMSGMFQYATALTNIDALADWGTSSVTNMSYMFQNASALTNIDALANWNTGNVTNMSNMFSGATALTNIDGASGWDTGSVTDMSGMFQYATALTNIDALANWNTSNVTNMSKIFFSADVLTNIDALANWDISNVTNMSDMFYGVNALTNIDALANWDISNVTNMSYMFAGASALTNIDALANWDTRNVTNMSYMFQYAHALTNIDGASGWNTSNVTNMSSMFEDATALTNIDGASGWDTSSVTNMSSMFRDARALTNIDGGVNWDTSNVTNMYRMFLATALTNIDGARNWNLNKVTSFTEMFESSPSHANFNRRPGTWDSYNTFSPVSISDSATITINPDSHVKSISFSNATHGTRTIVSGETISLAKDTEYTITAVYDSGFTLDSWSSTSGTIGSATSLSTTYQVASDDTLSITSTPASTSTVTLDIDSNVSSVSFSNPYYDTVTLLNNNDTITLVNGLDYNIIINYENGYKDSSITTTSNGTIGDTTIKGTTYIVTGDDTLSITTTEKTGTATLDTGSSLNAKMKTLAEGKTTRYDKSSSKIRALKMADFLPSDFTPSTANTVSVTNSEKPVYIFFDNTNDAGIMYFYSDAKEIYMNANSSSVFRYNIALTNIDALANWDTRNVTNMSNMFYNASALTNIDGASGWDTSSVTDMSGMFQYAYALTNIDGVRNWDTSKVTNMSRMFRFAHALTNIDGASGWDTSSVTDMSGMFQNAYALTNIDGEVNWNTSNVANMSGMFEDARALTNIDALANWDTSRVTNMSNMFYGAIALTNIDGVRNWDTSKVTNMSQMFRNASALTNIDALANWDTSNVTNTSYMFAGVRPLTNIDALADWDTSSVTNMSYMFFFASALTNIDGAINWDTSNVTNMSNMFEDAYALTNIDGARNWDTSKVTNMNSMFSGAYALTNIDGVRNWDTSKVTNMSNMFAGLHPLISIDALAAWDTSSVTNMSHMFAGTFTITDISALSTWNTGSVTNMSYMFVALAALTDSSAINDWDIRAVQARAGSSTESSNNFYRIFNEAYASHYPNFTKRSGTWNSEGTFIPDDTTVPTNSAVYVTVNFDDHVRSVSFQNSTYGTQQVTTSGSTVRVAKNTAYTISSSYEDGYTINSWSTTEGGTLVSTNTPATSYTVTGATTLTLTSKQAKTGATTLLPGEELNAKLKSLAEGTTTTYDASSSKIKALRMTDSLPADFTPSVENTVSVTGSEKPIYIFFDNTDDAGIMYFYSDAGEIYMNTDSSHAFSGNTALTDLSALSSWNTTDVTNMSSMFQSASALTNIDALAHWDTGSVTNMSLMFSQASALANINGASNWDTGNVTNMSQMFILATSLADITGASNWNTASVTNMGQMFRLNSALTDINALSGWNTSNVTSMRQMFESTSRLTNTSGANGWDVRNVRATAGSSTSSDNGFYNMFRLAGAASTGASYPTFTTRSGTWNSDGTFIPDDTTSPSSTPTSDTQNSALATTPTSTNNSASATQPTTATNPDTTNSPDSTTTSPLGVSTASNSDQSDLNSSSDSSDSFDQALTINPLASIAQDSTNVGPALLIAAATSATAGTILYLIGSRKDDDDDEDESED